MCKWCDRRRSRSRRLKTGAASRICTQLLHELELDPRQTRSALAQRLDVDHGEGICDIIA